MRIAISAFMVEQQCRRGFAGTEHYRPRGLHVQQHSPTAAPSSEVPVHGKILYLDCRAVFLRNYAHRHERTGLVPGIEPASPQIAPHHILLLVALEKQRHKGIFALAYFFYFHNYKISARPALEASAAMFSECHFPAMAASTSARSASSCLSRLMIVPSGPKRIMQGMPVIP